MNAIFVIAGVGVLALIAEIINLKRWLTPVIAIGLLASLVFLPLFTNNTEAAETYNNMLIFDGPAVALTWLIVFVAVLWLWASDGFLSEDSHKVDKTSLVVFVVLGAVIMVSYNNMAMLFLGLEILSLSLYALAGSRTKSLSSIEAAFKYFLMGSFATGFLLFGIALVYGATRSFEIGGIFEYLASNSENLPMFFYAGILMIFVGLAFKISAVPFHFWAPDVYDGAPTAVTALMATVVKVAALGAFWRMFGLCFTMTAGSWVNVLYGITALTILIPNITAIYQQKVKRMLAYSSIAHVGYMLLGFGGALQNKFVNPLFLVFYLAAYTVSSLAAFSVLMRVEKSDGSFAGLFYRNPMLAVTMTLALLSMAGIPPLAGFAAKFFVFVLAMGGNNPVLVGLTVLGVVGSLISVYYYLRVIVAMFQREPGAAPLPVSRSLKTLHFVLILLMLALGLFPSIGTLYRILGF